MNNSNDPVKPGHIKLVRLANEGRLACGDLVETQRLGVCEVVLIHDTHTLDVKATSGQHYRLTGLSFRGARLSRPAS